VGVQWQRLSRCDSDAPRAWHTAVVAESPSGSATRMITFAGEVTDADDSTTTFNDVAVFDLTDQIWFTPPVTGIPPSPRAVCIPPPPLFSLTHGFQLPSRGRMASSCKEVATAVPCVAAAGVDPPASPVLPLEAAGRCPSCG
jgi:hypothetical protein